MMNRSLRSDTRGVFFLSSPPTSLKLYNSPNSRGFFRFFCSKFIIFANMNQVQIRIAGSEDAAAIADLSRKTFYDSFAADNSKENMDHFLNRQFTRESL